MMRILNLTRSKGLATNSRKELLSRSIAYSRTSYTIPAFNPKSISNNIKGSFFANKTRNQLRFYQSSRFTLQKVNGYRSFNGGISPDTLIYGLIGVNGAVFLMWNSASGLRDAERFMINHFSLSLDSVYRFRIHTILTSGFSHMDPTHLFVNMLTLYFFGRDMCASMGSRRFLRFYILAQIAAGSSQLLFERFFRNQLDPYQNPRYNRSLGASGAVDAVVAYTLLRNPYGSVLIWGILPVPTALFGAYKLYTDVEGLLNPHSTVGNAAHLGGTFFGSLVYFFALI